MSDAERPFVGVWRTAGNAATVSEVDLRADRVIRIRIWDAKTGAPIRDDAVYGWWDAAGDQLYFNYRGPWSLDDWRTGGRAERRGGMVVNWDGPDRFTTSDPSDRGNTVAVWTRSDPAKNP